MRISIPLISAVILALTLNACVPGRLKGLKTVPPGQVPAAGTFYTLQNPDGPPLPYNPFPGSPVYSLEEGRFLIDDRAVDHEAVRQQAAKLGQAPAPSALVVPPPSDSGCAFRLTILATNNTAFLTLHHTRPGQSYTIWSIEDPKRTNWLAETHIAGGSGDTAQATVAMGSRAQLFFRASETRDYVTNLVFDGLSNSNSGATVPDTMGAVGLDHFVELLNGVGTNNAVAVYEKSGILISQTSLTNFFAANLAGTNYPTGAMADTRILFDHHSKRWVACAMQQTANIVILAVTKDQNPTDLASGWTKYVFKTALPAFTVDYPTLGLDDNGIYIAVEQLRLGIRHHTLIAIKKPAVYSGQLQFSTMNFTNDPPVRAVQPAVNFEAAAPDDYAWFVAIGPPELGANYQGGQLWYRRLKWAGTNVTWDTHWFTASDAGLNYRNYYELAGTNIGIFPPAGIGAPHLGGAVPIDLYSAGSRLMMATLRDGYLWTCHMVGLSGTNGVYAGDASGVGVDRSAVQWFKVQIAPGGTNVTIRDYGRVFDRAKTNNWWYYYPSLSVNCVGDMVMGFSGSSVSNYVGAFYTVRLANGSVLNQPRFIQPGKFRHDDNDWGDYSATTLDPADDWSFWTVQEYATPFTGPQGFTFGRWGTVITRIRPNP